MIDALNPLVRSLGALALVLSVLVLLILALRKPVRAWLGAVAAYNLWLLMVLWVPLYLVGTWLAPWLRMPQPTAVSATAATAGALQIDWTQLSLPLLDVAAGARDGASTIFLWPVVMIWAAGVVVLLLWQGARLWFFVLNVLQKAQPVHNLEWETMAGRSVPAVSLPGMGSAALFGVASPTLLLPEAFNELHDVDQQHIILAHESVHLRRNDNLWNVGASMVLVLFWWNPLMWLAWRCYRFDQELSCDALALTVCSQAQQKRYARTLLDSISELPGLGQHPALTAWGDLAQLKQRTLMVSKHLSLKTLPVTIRIGLLVTALVGIGLSLTMSAALAPARKPEVIPTIVKWTSGQPDSIQAPGQNTVNVRLATRSSTNTGSPQLPAATPAERTLSSEAGEKFKAVQELLNQHNFDDAQKLLLELEQQAEIGVLSDNEKRIVWQFQFQASIDMQDYAGARVAAMKVLDIAGLTNKERGDMQYLAAQVLVQQQKWQQAADELQQWAKQYPESVKPATAYLTAVALFQQGEKDRALHFAEEAVRLDKSGTVKAHAELLATLYLQTQSWAEARSAFRELVSQYPDSQTYRQQLAAVEQQLGQ